MLCCVQISQPHYSQTDLIHMPATITCYPLPGLHFTASPAQSPDPVSCTLLVSLLLTFCCPLYCFGLPVSTTFPGILSSPAIPCPELLAQSFVIVPLSIFPISPPESLKNKPLNQSQCCQPFSMTEYRLILGTSKNSFYAPQGA